MEDDWDLQAVVRGCSGTTTTTSNSAATTTTTTTTTCSLDVKQQPLCGFQPQPQKDSNFLCFQDLFEPRNGGAIEELHDLYKPFFPKPPPPPQQPLSPPSMPISPLSVLGGLTQDLSSQQQQHQEMQKSQLQQLVVQQQQIQLQPNKPLLPSIASIRSSATSGSNGTSHTQSPRSKRRKNQMKRVCQVPAEGLSSDMWSWRKYGQKPIKGSPYPRGYYRCSTSKGCLARKQVERNRSDPGMFIVTYTAEHNHPMPTHRNSLAGSTRNKPGTPTATTSGDTAKHSSSPPVSPSGSQSPVPENQEVTKDDKEDMVEDEEDDFDISNMAVDDDFFEGLEDLAGPAAGDCFPDHLPGSMQFPWLANNATTTAAGGV